MNKCFKVIAYDNRTTGTMIVVARDGEAWRIFNKRVLNIGEIINARKLNDFSWDWGNNSAFEKLPNMPANMRAETWKDG